MAPPRNQGSCGACWAFAAIACVESHVAIHCGAVLDLSEQNSVSCAAGMWGCCGGTVGVFDFFTHHGFALESCYLYGDRSYGCVDGAPASGVACRTTCPQPEAFHYQGWYTINSRNVDQVKTGLLGFPRP